MDASSTSSPHRTMVETLLLLVKFELGLRGASRCWDLELERRHRGTDTSQGEVGEGWGCKLVGGGRWGWIVRGRMMEGLRKVRERKGGRGWRR